MSKTGYHGLAENQYGGNKAEWKKISADFSQKEGHGEVLEIDGHPVMEQWEQPYMAALAGVATKQGGRVLEVGFGLGLSATAIQQTGGIDEHVIIEANEGVIARGREWAKKQPHKVTFHHGLWQDVLASLEPHSIDGVLYDTYPLTKEEQHIHQFDFLRQVLPAMKPGGVVTYCNLTSIGVLKGEHGEWQAVWERTQLPHLNRLGYTNASFATVPVSPPDTCAYYGGHTEALLPTMFKAALRKPTFVTVAEAAAGARGQSLKVKLQLADEQALATARRNNNVVGPVAGAFKAADASGYLLLAATAEETAAFRAAGKPEVSALLRNVLVSQLGGAKQAAVGVFGVFEICSEEHDFAGDYKTAVTVEDERNKNHVAAKKAESEREGETTTRKEEKKGKGRDRRGGKRGEKEEKTKEAKDEEKKDGEEKPSKQRNRRNKGKKAGADKKEVDK